MRGVVYEHDTRGNRKNAGSWVTPELESEAKVFSFVQKRLHRPLKYSVDLYTEYDRGHKTAPVKTLTIFGRGYKVQPTEATEEPTNENL